MSSIFEVKNDIVAASPKIKHAYLRNTIWWKGFKSTWSYLKFQRTMNLKKKELLMTQTIKELWKLTLSLDVVLFIKRLYLKFLDWMMKILFLVLNMRNCHLD